MGEDTPENLTTSSDIAPAINRGITVYYKNEAYTVDSKTTAGELKSQIGAADGDRLTYREDGENHAVDDDARLVDHVPDKSKIRFQPVGEGDMFG